jgi:hypothetical protein
MECKIIIGIAYEPVWFEKRTNNGTYSAKNPILDGDCMWLQGALIGIPKQRTSNRLPFSVLGITAIVGLFYWAYGAL